ncbi:hypothetical protein IFR05_009132 [Cadophora sp. M221]|nr:hypothetical protein IFR05_009132 [Cadophora sp. M221]
MTSHHLAAGGFPSAEAVHPDVGDTAEDSVIRDVNASGAIRVHQNAQTSAPALPASGFPGASHGSPIKITSPEDQEDAGTHDIFSVGRKPISVRHPARRRASESDVFEYRRPQNYASDQQSCQDNDSVPEELLTPATLNKRLVLDLNTMQGKLRHVQSDNHLLFGQVKVLNRDLAQQAAANRQICTIVSRKNTYIMNLADTNRRQRTEIERQKTEIEGLNLRLANEKGALAAAEAYCLQSKNELRRLTVHVDYYGPKLQRRIAEVNQLDLGLRKEKIGRRSETLPLKWKLSRANDDLQFERVRYRSLEEVLETSYACQKGLEDCLQNSEYQGKEKDRDLKKLKREIKKFKRGLERARKEKEEEECIDCIFSAEEKTRMIKVLKDRDDMIQHFYSLYTCQSNDNLRLKESHAAEIVTLEAVKGIVSTKDTKDTKDTTESKDMVAGLAIGVIRLLLAFFLYWAQ